MPMPTSTTLISPGVDGESSVPVSRAVPTTMPAAAPPMTETASSGSSAANRLRKTSTCSSTITPTITSPTTIDRVFSASSESTVSAKGPVNPVRSPASWKTARVWPRNAR